MSESSLPPFGPGWLRRPRHLRPSTRLKGLLTGLLKRLPHHHRTPAGEHPVPPGAPEKPATGLEARAEGVILKYLKAHAGIFERAARLREKAERLEAAGIPSETARNRAERALEEVAAGLAGLRASFLRETGEEEGGRAFDLAAKRHLPVL